MYEPIVVKSGRVFPIAGADRIGYVEMFGTKIVVNINTNPDTLGIYFRSDGIINPDFLRAANLMAKKPDGSKGGGFFGDNGRVRCQIFKGIKSDGFWMPLSKLNCWVSDNEIGLIKKGDIVKEANGTWLARKFVLANKSREKSRVEQVQRAKCKARLAEHYNTAHLWVGICNVPEEAFAWVTEKLHGTSQRSGTYRVDRPRTWYQSIYDRFMSWWDLLYQAPQEIVEEHGTRRVPFVVADTSKYRHYWAERFAKATRSMMEGDSRFTGISVYYELVGPNIQGGHSYKDSIRDKELKKRIKAISSNETTNFRYGNDIVTAYVYRILVSTKVNGVESSKEMNYEQIRDFCNIYNFNIVPLIHTFHYSTKQEAVDYLKELSEEYDCSSSLLDPTCVSEGFCVTFSQGLSGCPPFDKALKYKGFVFKVGEGVAKDKAAEEGGEADIEEMEAE